MQKNKIEINFKLIVEYSKIIFKATIFCVLIGFLLNQFWPPNYTSEIHITPGVLNKKEIDPKSILIEMRTPDFYGDLLTGDVLTKLRILQDGKTICLSVTLGNKKLLENKTEDLKNLILKKQNSIQEKIILSKTSRLNSLNVDINSLNVDIDNIKKTISKASSDLSRPMAVNQFYSFQSLNQIYSNLNQVYSNLIAEKIKIEDSQAQDINELTKVTIYKPKLSKPPFFPLSIIFGFLIGSILSILKLNVKIKN